MYSNEIRKQAIDLHARGTPVTEICSRLQIGRSTLYSFHNIVPTNSIYLFRLYPQSQYGPPDAKVYSLANSDAPPASAIA